MLSEEWAWRREVAGASSHAIGLLFAPSASDALGDMAWRLCNLDDDFGLLVTAIWHVGSIIESGEDLTVVVRRTLGNREGLESRKCNHKYAETNTAAGLEGRGYGRLRARPTFKHSGLLDPETLENGTPVLVGYCGCNTQAILCHLPFEAYWQLLIAVLG